MTITYDANRARIQGFGDEGFVDGLNESTLWATTKQDELDYIQGKIKGLREKETQLRESMMEDLLKQKVRDQ